MATRWSIVYRPSRLSRILGQSHIVEYFKIILSQYFEEGKPLPVGALFGGHSGVGKTTLARVLAASLNCKSREGVEPCGKCETCKQIIQGVGGTLEIDAAFFGSVENVRILRERLGSYAFSDYQVVILDECHMMSKEAFNVLLKLLEEPPDKVFFILVTTEAFKVPDTVKSRLLEFRFRAIKWSTILIFLQRLLKREEVSCADDLLYRLYRLSTYNLREVIVLLEHLSVLGNKKITKELIDRVCGEAFIYENIFEKIKVLDYEKVISLYDEFSLFQSDFGVFLDGFLIYLGDALKKNLKMGGGDRILLAVCLRGIYKFMSLRLNLRGIAAARLLFFDLIESARKLRAAPQEEDKITKAFETLTKPS